MAKSRRRSSIARAFDRVWAALRYDLGDQQADCVVVFRCFMDGEGGWSAEYVARHWVDGVESKLPEGVPGAITKAVMDDVVVRHLGPMAGDVITEIGKRLIQNFRNRGERT
jgi:hypothetical protein